MSIEIRPIPLRVAGVSLEPLAESHREGLRAAGDDARIWTHMPYTPMGAAFDVWFDQALETCSVKECGWAVRSPGGALVGSTRFLAIEPAHRRAEIGHTWYAPAAWGGLVNPACKFALMRYGFEILALNRIELKTDIRNSRSQAAIAKLGAQREGVLRAHMIRPDGSLRDSVYFSVIRGEWTRVKASLFLRLEEVI